MFMVASSVVSTILILNYHHRNADTHEMSEWVSVLGRGWSAKKLGLKLKNNKSQHPNDHSCSWCYPKLFLMNQWETGMLFQNRLGFTLDCSTPCLNTWSHSHRQKLRLFPKKKTYLQNNLAASLYRFCNFTSWTIHKRKSYSMRTEREASFQI